MKGAVTPRRPVPLDIVPPPYALPGGAPPVTYPPATVHDAAGIAAMRTSCAVAAEALAYAGTLVKPGITTDEIDALLHEWVVKHPLRPYPSPLGYAGFPKSVCTSINEIVCHGIPDNTAIQAGDIVKLDVSVYVNGHHGDTCRTFVAGGIDCK